MANARIRISDGINNFDIGKEVSHIELSFNINDKDVDSFSLSPGRLYQLLKEKITTGTNSKSYRLQSKKSSDPQQQ